MELSKVQISLALMKAKVENPKPPTPAPKGPPLIIDVASVFMIKCHFDMTLLGSIMS